MSETGANGGNRVGERGGRGREQAGWWVSAASRWYMNTNANKGVCVLIHVRSRQ